MVGRSGGGAIATSYPSAEMKTHDAKDAITHVERTTTTKPNKDVDTAARWLADAHIEDAAFTYEEEHAVLRRIDFRVLPLLLGAYFFQQVGGIRICLRLLYSYFLA